MTLSQLLNPKLVLTKCPCESKDELISKVIERIYSAGAAPPIPQEELLQAILKRERIGGTLLPSGLSVPHARLGDFEDFIFAIAPPAESISHDGFPLHLMSLMISSQMGGAYYLPVVAALTKISRDKEFFSRLAEAENSETLISIIKEKDQQLG